MRPRLRRRLSTMSFDFIDFWVREFRNVEHSWARLVGLLSECDFGSVLFEH